ncbi:hypothetical protein [Amycolatopsis sp. NPDC021455]|uniref:hypothetical protein n=1 Tax=Amycolatopsis sp. NPDC021455 TaxID=3154901 RepID=UPI0033EF92DE
MGATWTSPGWCPPTVDGQRYAWTISFKPAGRYWSPQSCLIGGSPTGVDLEALLHRWFLENGGPAARWRVQVSPLGDESTVLAGAVLTFTEPVERQVRRLGPKPGPITPTFWALSDLKPPLPEQIRAWEARPEGPPEAWKARPAAPDVPGGSAQ